MITINLFLLHSPPKCQSAIDTSSDNVSQGYRVKKTCNVLFCKNTENPRIKRLVTYYSVKIQRILELMPNKTNQLYISEINIRYLNLSVISRKLKKIKIILIFHVAYFIEN